MKPTPPPPPPLPYDAQIEYLESTSVQYIDTGYSFMNNYSWEIRCTTPGFNQSVFGGVTPQIRTALLYRTWSGYLTSPIGNMNSGATPFQFGQISGVHTFELKIASQRGSAWIDGVLKYDNVGFTGEYISGIPQAIFASHNGSSIVEHAASRVYFLRMYEADTLVRDFIPVRVGNVGYMYDRVSGQLFGNAGRGDFILGPDVE